MSTVLFFCALVHLASSTCPRSFNEVPAPSPAKTDYDSLKLDIRGTGGCMAGAPKCIEPSDAAFHQGYVGDTHLIKIPHSAFMDGPNPVLLYTGDTYGLLPNKAYHFAVSLFDPYTIRTFTDSDETQWYGHTSVFTAEEWSDCIIKPTNQGGDGSQIKYAGYFHTGPDKKITSWDNESGHFAPYWVDPNTGKKNWLIFQTFWGWTGGAGSNNYNVHPAPPSRFIPATVAVEESMLMMFTAFVLMMACCLCLVVHTMTVCTVGFGCGWMAQNGIMESAVIKAGETKYEDCCV